MDIKFTFGIWSIAIRVTLTLLFSFYSTFTFSQTITDISPTKVTKGTKVTITGTGLTPGIKNAIEISNDFVLSDFIKTGTTQITFIVSSAGNGNFGPTGRLHRVFFLCLVSRLLMGLVLLLLSIISHHRLKVFTIRMEDPMTL